MVLKNLIGIPFRSKGHDTHQDRDRVLPFFRQGPLDDPWFILNYDSLDEPTLFQLMQPHNENPGRQSRKRPPDLVKPVDLQERNVPRARYYQSYRHAGVWG